MSYFLDTNIILRFLAKDDEKQYLAVKRLLTKADEGEIKLATSALVIFEVIWTLISYYEEPKNQIIEKMISLLEFPNLSVEHKNIFLPALLLWQNKNVEFNDAFNCVWCQKNNLVNVFSYDKHFSDLPNIKRIEPF